jgi:hypothetical protein
MLAHILSHALQLLLSDEQDHKLHANREGRRIRACVDSKSWKQTLYSKYHVTL